MKCQQCGKVLVGRQKKFCGRVCNNRHKYYNTLNGRNCARCGKGLVSKQIKYCSEDCKLPRIEEVRCDYCGDVLPRKRAITTARNQRVRGDKHKFCSKEHCDLFKVGKPGSRLGKGKYVPRIHAGYLTVHAPQNPGACRRTGYIPEHRLVVS